MEQQYIQENLWNGGVHLDEQMFREIAGPSFCCQKASLSYQSVPDPMNICLEMRDDSGAPCNVLVKEGEHVRKWDIIGVRDPGIPQDYHVIRTGISGIVTAVRRERTGYNSYTKYVDIQACDEGEYEIELADIANDAWSGDAKGLQGKNHANELVCKWLAEDYIEHDWRRLADDRLCVLLQQSGIPGISKVLFHGAGRRRCQVVILNAIVDDPSLFYNSLMLRERPGQILYGLFIFLRLLGAEHVMITAMQYQASEVQRFLQGAERYFDAKMRQRISVVFVPDKYPGGRADLLMANLNSKLRGQTGTIVSVDQSIGAYNMLYDHKPWVSRRLLVGGCTDVGGYYEVPVGMALSDLPSLYNICRPISAYVIIDGGLMAGKALNPEHARVHSGMQSIIVLPRLEENEQLCRHCGQCAAVCPAGLHPQDGCMEAERGLCIGCGSCSYICPSRRRLTEFMVRGCQKVCDVKGQNNEGEVPKGYVYLPADCGLQPAAATGYSAPYIRLARQPFTCILSPFQL